MGLRIKPLEWRPSNYDRLMDARVDDWVYVISDADGEFTLDGFYTEWGYDTDRQTRHPDIESAKVAANKHHAEWLMKYLEECND